MVLKERSFILFTRDGLNRIVFETNFTLVLQIGMHSSSGMRNSVGEKNSEKEKKNGNNNNVLASLKELPWHTYIKLCRWNIRF